ncbi:hypothetical protein BWI15_37875 [Kribbella sp. ALI-6-A]|uniref:hypothetical protein n=1 Tax=Kribbella sp. ALI-6-A TaxID=1933817 RepID=UPI00097BFC4B|nr:hypothetical protein [Kribbella sp. ALI-6-A]ONI68745.1 hypothetical protein BWI15_37875 [Kribbella sp. ALI-6-A]
MNDQPVDYATFQAEMHRLLANLDGAAPELIEAETSRLQAMAEQIPDERDREHALFRAGSLPRLVAGPPPATSEQFDQAQVLFAQAINSEEPAQTRIPQIEQAIREIGALAAQAPRIEAGAIRRLNSTLSRLKYHLESSSR